MDRFIIFGIKYSCRDTRRPEHAGAAVEMVVYVPADILAKIKSRMAEYDFTQEALTSILALTQPRLSEMLSGQRPFKKKALAQLMPLLDLEELQQYVPEPLSATEQDEQECVVVLQMMGEGLRQLPPHERQEVLLSLALSLEAKPPYGPNRQSRVLRAIARMLSTPRHRNGQPPP